MKANLELDFINSTDKLPSKNGLYMVYIPSINFEGMLFWDGNKFVYNNFRKPNKNMEILWAKLPRIFPDFNYKKGKYDSTKLYDVIVGIVNEADTSLSTDEIKQILNVYNVSYTDKKFTTTVWSITADGNLELTWDWKLEKIKK